MLDADGKLLPDFRPAAYMDSCILIDWYRFFSDVPSWMSVDEVHPEQFRTESLSHSLLCDFLNREKRATPLAKFREQLHLGQTSVHCIASPLAITELAGWVAEANFLALHAEVSGVKAVQAEGRKSVAQKLRRLQARMLNPEPGDICPTNNESVFRSLDCSLNPVFISEHMGEFLKPNQLSITAQVDTRRLAQFAYLQVGLADILHLECAHGYGCEYFVTEDQDFLDNKESIAQAYSIKPVRLKEFTDILASTK
ncbi:MAG: hypothetical protein ACK5ZG_08135 [Phycisphaerae bacterium]